MILAGIVYFAVCALVVLLGAVGVVASRDPIRSAVSLLASILGVAGLYLKLSAEFLAAIQVIVYAGAVVVLFVFVIMLLGPDAGSRVEPSRARPSRVVGAVVAAAVALAAVLLLLPRDHGLTSFGEVPAGFGGIEAVGGHLFTRALLPFELATALLIAAVVGAIALSRGRGVIPKAPPPPVNPTARMFGGPVHPRDAGRPLGEEGMR
ncbi:MAG: NADH-quinone oxidoreductase subunit J [Polyangiaceae bacterium]|nr:NADH-quinone oxidoreductase subunit J [Polyangiaceae bacterium]